MKMIATWFRQGRGLAIGTVVGALTVGKATPYLLKALPEVSLEGVVLGRLLGGVPRRLSWFSPSTGTVPSPSPRPLLLGPAGRVARHRETRLATLGYLGHMWELYAMWTWVPAFLLASAGRGHRPWASVPQTSWWNWPPSVPSPPGVWGVSGEGRPLSGSAGSGW